MEQAGGEFAQYAEVCYVASGNVGPLVRKRTSGRPFQIDNVQVSVLISPVPLFRLKISVIPTSLNEVVSKLTRPPGVSLVCAYHSMNLRPVFTSSV